VVLYFSPNIARVSLKDDIHRVYKLWDQRFVGAD
jgi:hypothetical protein